jgi:hypothetical protein
LIEAAYIDDAADGGIVVQGYFAMRREKNNFCDGMVEMLRNREGLHIADPTAAAGMDRITDFIVAFQNEGSHSLPRCGCGCGESSGATTHN